MERTYFGDLPAPPQAAVARPRDGMDAELITACKAGDGHAFEQLVHKYEARVYTHCLRMVGDEQESADLMQEVFLKVFRNIGNYEQTYAFYTWVYRITVNCCIDFLRKRRRRHGSLTLSMEKPDGPGEAGREREIADETYVPDRLLANAELREALDAAIGKLSEKLRAIVILKEIEGYSYEEIGRTLGCSRGTVKSRLFRARERLRELLTPSMERGAL